VKKIVHFAHGNGFPSPCYKQLLQYLEKRYEICYVDQVGHSPAFPVSDNWHNLVKEVIDSIATQSTQPVIALGHSLGGILSLLAALEQPSLFKAVVLLDSPLLGRLKSSIVRFSKVLGMIDHLTPAYRSRYRRQHWESHEQALAYLKSRKLFKTFTDACLNDYIDYGMKKNEEGYSLRFDRKIEYQIYRTIPHILHQYEGKLQVPTALIYGNKSTVVDRLDLRYMKKHYGIVGVETKGTHMFPMEYPAETANLILEVINKLLNK